MITNFPLKSSYNPGGFRKFQFVPSYLVLNYPDIQSGQITQPINLLSGAAWLLGYSTPGTLVFEEEGTDTDNGKVFKQVISGFVPGDKLILMDLMNNMEGLPFVVQLTDASGHIRILGTHGHRLVFSAKYGSGGERSETKGYQFKFSGEAKYRAPVYNV